VAVGFYAGATGQGAGAIAIGNGAGQTSQPANTVALGASATPNVTHMLGFGFGTATNPVVTAGGTTKLPLRVTGNAVTTDHNILLDGLTLDGLTNVATTAPLMGEVVAYDSTTSSWKNNALIWNDLIGYIENPSGGGSTPPNYTLISGRSQYGFSMRTPGNTEMYFKFHPNHNWRPGLDFDFHIHIMTDSPTEDGTADFQAIVTYAQVDSALSTEVTLATLSKTFTAGDQLKHFLVEVPMGRPSPTAEQVDSDLIDVDSIIMVKLLYNNATSTIATNSSLFVIQGDIHYQSYGAVGTRLQSSPFD
jgi:hypothetical protein